jgi:hypothetical protein
MSKSRSYLPKRFGSVMESQYFELLETKMLIQFGVHVTLWAFGVDAVATARGFDES